MQATQLVHQITRLVRRGTHGVLDVFGPTVEFLVLPEESLRRGADYWIRPAW
jgi:hypothetical protein